MQAWQKKQRYEARMRYVFLKAHRNMKTCMTKVYSTGADRQISAAWAYPFIVFKLLFVLFLFIFFYGGQLLRVVSAETTNSHAHVGLRLVGGIRKERHILPSTCMESQY